MNSLIIGTRGSKLALAQTQLVIDALKKIHPEIELKTKIISTKGDTNQSPIPAGAIGKTWFTAEIEQALLASEIDIAVHSLKDVPPQIPDQLVVFAVLERGDPRDALIGKPSEPKITSVRDLPPHAIVGTDSIRRKALLLEERPDLVIQSIRGNIDTRLKKLESENYDAIVLAAAGLERIGISGRAAQFLDPSHFVPAMGQGILAAETRKDNKEVLEMLRGIMHPSTLLAASAEQAFSRVIGGGCKLPIGCYARVEEKVEPHGNAHDEAKIFIYAMMESGNRIIRKSINGSAGDAVALAETIAKQILDEAA